MKHCTDCRFFRPKQDSSLEYGLCSHDKARQDYQTSEKLRQWLVSGTGDRPPEDIAWNYASTMRAFDCGVDAKLFEPMPDTEAQTERRKDHDFDAKGQQ